MTAPSLTQVFGAGATQTATQLIIAKADLVANGGLTATATNSADSLLAAVIAQAQLALPESTVTSNADQNVGIADGFQSIQSNGTNQQLVSPKTISFYKTFTGGAFNPNDY